MRNTTIRTATPADIEAILSLWIELVREQQAFGTRIKAVENRTVAKKWTADLIARDRILVADLAEAIVGFVSFEIEHDRFERTVTTGVIHNLVVEEEHRNAGIGSQLLQRAESHLGADGADRIRLEAMADNSKATRFYHDHGYRTHRITLAKSVEQIDTHNIPDPEG